MVGYSDADFAADDKELEEELDEELRRRLPGSLRFPFATEILAV